jgi:hypothetical protein
MDVKLNAKIGPVGRNSTVQSRAQKPPPKTDSVRLDQSARLDRSLAATPEIRSEAVQRARELIADTTYPSKETLGKVAMLLAANIGASQK